LSCSIGSVYSAAGLPRNGDPEQTFADLFANPAASNRKIKLLWIGIGRQDPGFESAQKLSDLLHKHEIDHIFHPSEGRHAAPAALWQVGDLPHGESAARIINSGLTVD
jgi:hypothetical protein